ncbi:MAG TPA: zinc ribbon domain-containing protein [Baekduia sp.]|nr:zinc ribbon domain-containing protein [Baekduia sp.]
MPIYEYRRPDGTTFEVRQKFSDAPLTADPETGEPVERVLHAPAVHFKGKGWYATDVGSQRQRKLLERAAEQGANDHDDKMRAQRAERAKAKAKAQQPKAKP